MNVSNMLASEMQQQPASQQSSLVQQNQSHSHQYPTRRSMSANLGPDNRLATPPDYAYDGDGGVASLAESPTSPAPKNVAFELHFDGSPNVRGRLPMRVQIFPHDTTESIVTTVKNFYGLYDSASQGVSFEDIRGNTLIGSYENFTNDMTVYVRVIPDLSQIGEYQNQWAYHSTSPQRMNILEDGERMLPPQPAQILNYGQPPSRPGSRVSRKQSASPKLSQARSASSQKSRSRPGLKGQGSNFQAGLDELNDAHNGYSSSDGGAGSVTSSRKAKSEQLVTAEISVDNIVEGGRRKRAKFESSELPLFVPPQVPAPNSISSISPQRRSNGADNPSPFARPAQRTFSFNIPVAQNHPYSDVAMSTPLNGSPFTIPPVPNHGHRLRDRNSGTSLSARSSLGSNNRPYGSNILPTPDPTIASCISDEDVALQLMRLGEASNFSHGRTSASTLDDAFSGRADAASSASSNSESDSDETEGPHASFNDVRLKIELGANQLGPPTKRQRHHNEDTVPRCDTGELSAKEADGDYNDGIYHADLDQPSFKAKSKSNKIKKARGTIMPHKLSRLLKQTGASKRTKSASSHNPSQQPISPASMPSQSRKASSASTINFQHQPGADEDDLSSKPRCQRCRKSKKGCDRQRPCQRCKDAGIGIEGCVSEDEGNGRKGRFGRHMGVPVKRSSDDISIDNESETASAILSGMASAQTSPEKSKKRKR